MVLKVQLLFICCFLPLRVTGRRFEHAQMIFDVKVPVFYLPKNQKNITKSNISILNKKILNI